MSSCQFDIVIDLTWFPSWVIAIPRSPLGYLVPKGYKKKTANAIVSRPLGTSPLSCTTVHPAYLGTREVLQGFAGSLSLYC